MLTACGDEVTEVTNVNASLNIVEKYKELPKCEESVYGSLNYVEDSSQVFACTPDGWVSLKGEKGAKGDEGKAGENGKNGESCTTKSVEGGVEVSCPGSKSVVIKNGDKGAEGKAGENGKNGESCTTKSVEGGVEVSCPGSEPVVIKNGDKGAEGKAGENGKNGESCTTKAVEGGVEVNCPGSEPVVIKNGDKGAEGKAGENGENGTSCNIVSDKDGVVTIQCGEGENAKTTELYKAVCGTKPFDPKHQFCFDNVVYNQCGDKVYDPSKEFCSNEVVYDLCGGNVYDPSKEFCSNEVVYDLCGGKAYDPELQSCTKVQFADNTEQYYKTVTIAPEGTDYSETWMAENLNYKTANSWCYDDKDENCAKYGRLYTWVAAVGKTETECGDGQECNLGDGNVQGVCPEGWHLPSQEEWKDLFKAVGGQATAGAKLKSKTGWVPFEGINNEDAFGFSALPAGDRDDGGGYREEGNGVYFWSSTEDGGSRAYGMDFYCSHKSAYLVNDIKNNGFSVRCLKD
jgi:uncharacterized protein (TIGR02145 family)